MEYTLWRGQVLLGHATLEPSAKDSRRIRGTLQPTDELETLGPMAQHRWPGGRLTQVSTPRAPDIRMGGPVQSDIEIVEVWESDSSEDWSPPEVLPDDVLKLVGPEGPVDTEMIWIVEPPVLPANVLQSLPSESRKRLIQWKLSCRLSESRPGAA